MAITLRDVAKRAGVSAMTVSRVINGSAGVDADTQRRVEDDLARLAEAAIERDFPVLYTCYGIGVLTRVIGGTL